MSGPVQRAFFLQLNSPASPLSCLPDIEVACYAYEGVDAVKAALNAGLKLSTEDMKVNINLIAPPLYVVTTNTLDKEGGVRLLNEVCAGAGSGGSWGRCGRGKSHALCKPTSLPAKVIEEIQKVITAKEGIMNVKREPRSVTESEDKELESAMEKYEQENREVGGDDDNSDGEGGAAQ